MSRSVCIEQSPSFCVQGIFNGKFCSFEKILIQAKNKIWFYLAYCDDDIFLWDSFLSKWCFHNFLWENTENKHSENLPLTIGRPPWAAKFTVATLSYKRNGRCGVLSDGGHVCWMFRKHCLVILEMWQGSRNLCLCLSNSDMKHWKALRGRCSQQYQWNPRVGAINGNQKGLLSKIYNLQTNMDSWALPANSRSQCLPYSLPCPASHLLPVFTSMWNKWSFIYNWLHFTWLALPPSSKVAMGRSP